MASGVVYPAVDLDSVLPHPVADIVEINLPKVLLADRTNTVFQDWIAGYGDILEFRGFRG